MNTVEPEDAAAPAGSDQSPGWRLGTRVAFRFSVVYFALFCLLYPQITFVFTGIMGWQLPPEAVVWQMNALGPLTEWVGRHVFGIDAALHPDSRSGDQAAMWVFMFNVLVVALVASVIWSILDRRRGAYPRLHAWFLLFIRICLGGQMLYYGAVKVIPLQMPAPPLASLLRPYGQLSPTWVLWLQVGSSYPYEIALGVVELVAGVLLFVPSTATLGALVALAAMTQVFLLNMTFDVSVKILSFQLVALAVVLLAPQAKRLANMLILQKPSAPATQPPLFTHPRATQVANAVQVGLGTWVLVGSMLIGWLMWHSYGGGRPKPELYGIWSVTTFTLDGAALPPLTTQQHRWQRLIIDDPDTLTYQQMDGELVTVPATVGAHRITFFDTAASATLTIHRINPDQLRLTGQLNRHPVAMTLNPLTSTISSAVTNFTGCSNTPTTPWNRRGLGCGTPGPLPTMGRLGTRLAVSQ